VGSAPAIGCGSTRLASDTGLPCQWRCWNRPGGRGPRQHTRGAYAPHSWSAPALWRFGSKPTTGSARSRTVDRKAAEDCRTPGRWRAVRRRIVFPLRVPASPREVQSGPFLHGNRPSSSGRYPAGMTKRHNRNRPDPAHAVGPGCRPSAQGRRHRR